MNNKKRKLLLIFILCLVLIGILITIFIAGNREKPLLTLYVGELCDLGERYAEYRYTVEQDGTLTHFKREYTIWPRYSPLDNLWPRYSTAGEVVLSEADMQSLMALADELPLENVEGERRLGGTHIIIRYNSRVYMSAYFEPVLRDELYDSRVVLQNLMFLVDEILRLSPTSIDLEGPGDYS